MGSGVLCSSFFDDLVLRIIHSSLFSKINIWLCMFDNVYRETNYERYSFLRSRSAMAKIVYITGNEN